jgi:hypothetical protein
LSRRGLRWLAPPAVRETLFAQRAVGGGFTLTRIIITIAV